MATTFIDTNKIPRIDLAGGAGTAAEILNRELCGAENVVATLRWLGASDRLNAQALADTHQLIYLMDGDGIIALNGKDYAVSKGAGVYLGPTETASVRPKGPEALKLFHLVVPAKKD